MSPATPSRVQEHKEHVSTEQATAALQTLADAAATRQSELQQFPNSPQRPDSDEDNDSPSPIFEQFYASGGSAAIVQMTNLDVSEFQKI